MSENDQNAKQASNGQGFFIRGTYLGAQPARTFTRAGTSEEVNVKPKLGVSVDGEEYSIKARDDDHLAATIAGKVKGDLITLAIEARAPFGSGNKPVEYVLPGVVESRQQWH